MNIAGAAILAVLVIVFSFFMSIPFFEFIKPLTFDDPAIDILFSVLPPLVVVMAILGAGYILLRRQMP